MFASVRCYFVHRAPAHELVRRVDADFAERIAAQPGFVSYEFLDGGGGDAMTISMFEEPAQAEASRELARRWSEEQIGDLELTLTETLHGAVRVSRAGPEIRRHGQASPGSYASVRRYRLSGGDLDALLRAVDAAFAERVQGLEGFLSYRVLDCSDGEMLSVSVFCDEQRAAASDALAVEFVRERLGAFDLRRTDMIGGGEVVVSRVAETQRRA